MKEYFTIDALNASLLKEILENPYKVALGCKKEQTESMIFGSAIHALILEPERFREDFAVLPNLDLRKKQDKESMAEFKAKNEDKIFIKSDAYIDAMHVANSFKETEFFPLIAECEKEKVFLKKINNINMKCMCDAYDAKNGIIYDLKTTSKINGAKKQNFTRDIYALKYHVQAAFYLSLTGAKKFVFLALETEPPFMVGAYTLNDVFLQRGAELVSQAIETYKNLESYKENIYRDSMGGLIETIEYFKD